MQAKSQTGKKHYGRLRAQIWGIFEQGNVGGFKPILQLSVMAYENTKVGGGRDWRFFSLFYSSEKEVTLQILNHSDCVPH
jgi:hypothetical protein